MQKIVVKLTDETTEECYIYVARAGDSNAYKIGWATSPRQRFSNLQVGNHTPIDVLSVFPVSGRHVERKIHDIFANQRIRGEWFSLTTTDLLDIMDEDRRLLLIGTG